MPSRHRARLRASLLLALVPLALPPTAALPHAVLERKEATIDASYRGVVQITHGCGGRATTRVTVTIPEGMVGAKPMPKPGWQVATTRGAYARAYPHYHGSLSEGVKTITWSGGELPDDQVDEFTFFARVADAFAPGSTAYFPVEQECAGGSQNWVQIPASGQSPRDLEAPAPGVVILVAHAAEKPRPAATIRAGDLAIEQPWLRATPAGAKVAAGYVRITNTGAAPDRLTGASIPLAARGDVHSMSTEGGVMRMAPVTGGLVIEPGKSVELKPGGLHLMFEDLRAGPKVGESVAGTLTFERAGTVPVTFTVAPIGARAPGSPDHHH